MSASRPFRSLRTLRQRTTPSARFSVSPRRSTRSSSSSYADMFPPMTWVTRITLSFAAIGLLAWMVHTARLPSGKCESHECDMDLNGSAYWDRAALDLDRDGSITLTVEVKKGLAELFLGEPGRMLG